MIRYKIKIWVIDLDKPDYEQLLVPPINKEVFLEKRIPKKHVITVLLEQIKKMLEFRLE